MKQPKFYMSAIFCDPMNCWLVAFTLAKSKKAAAENAFEWINEKSSRRSSSAKALQTYTSPVFHDDGVYWVRPRGWSWSEVLSKDLCSHFSVELTTQKEVQEPIRDDGLFPDRLADVAFVYGEDRVAGLSNHFPSDASLAELAERISKQFANQREGRGEGQFDIRIHLQGYGSRQGYSVDFIADCKCSCGSSVFELLVDDLEGVAQRVCTQCSDRHTLADGANYLEDAELQTQVCDCGEKSFEVSVGVHVYRDGKQELTDNVRWLYLGVRCLACKRLGIAGNWKNDFEPVQELLALV